MRFAFLLPVALAAPPTAEQPPANVTVPVEERYSEEEKHWRLYQCVRMVRMDLLSRKIEDAGELGETIRTNSVNCFFNVEQEKDLKMFISDPGKFLKTSAERIFANLLKDEVTGEVPEMTEERLVKLDELIAQTEPKPWSPREKFFMLGGILLVVFALIQVVVVKITPPKIEKKKK
jgi:hypothetical protein